MNIKPFLLYVIISLHLLIFPALKAGAFEAALHFFTCLWLRPVRADLSRTSNVPNPRI